MKPLTILITGPLPVAGHLEPHLQRMMEEADAVKEMGHVPVMGRWVGEARFETSLATVARQVLHHCDGVIRIKGPCVKADEIVQIAVNLNKRVYRDRAELPIV
ncbi:hypothetical protein [Paraflavitalea pollutisoli]|uniref:hypothetical protein n=1 Tax=Paraflavitalea pollutisoli TaxID=3034143 RepID=UPI0023EDD22C|nr:hypothetical protein [Paraflavitalea sp. H1-2-19X]